jgi:hypothetical protein
VKIIAKPIRGGKTHDIIKACSEQGGYIVCRNVKAVQGVAQMARIMKITIPYPITFREFIEGGYHAPGVQKFHIDNADLCLQEISPIPIKTISITSEVLG